MRWGQLSIADDSIPPMIACNARSSQPISRSTSSVCSPARPQPSHRRRALRKPRRDSRDRHLAVARVPHVLEEPGLLQIRIVEQIGQRVGRTTWNVELAQHCPAIPQWCGAHAFGQHRVERIDIVGPRGNRGEPRIIDQRGTPIASNSFRHCASLTAITLM